MCRVIFFYNNIPGAFEEVLRRGLFTSDRSVSTCCWNHCGVAAEKSLLLVMKVWWDRRRFLFTVVKRSSRSDVLHQGERHFLSVTGSPFSMFHVLLSSLLLLFLSVQSWMSVLRRPRGNLQLMILQRRNQRRQKKTRHFWNLDWSLE